MARGQLRTMIQGSVGLAGSSHNTMYHVCDPSQGVRIYLLTAEGIIRVIALIVALSQPTHSAIIRLRIRPALITFEAARYVQQVGTKHFSLFPNKIAITPKTQLKNINLCFFQVCSGLDFNSHLKLNWGVNPYRWFEAFGVKTTPVAPAVSNK